MKFDPILFMKEVRRLGHNAVLGTEFVSHGEDWAELALPYAEHLVGDIDTGILASGPILSLMDMACGLAVWIRCGVFVPQATLDLRVDYLRPATPGKTVIGRAECYRMTRSIAFARGIAHDGDAEDPLAHVAGTFMFTGPMK
jgi:uncharacterized protein (TIGR00369 family)